LQKLEKSKKAMKDQKDTLKSESNEK
jgi:hypothetical protein